MYIMDFFSFLLKKKFKKNVLRCKINVQGRNLIHKNNRTVPNKDCTEGKCGRKKNLSCTIIR